MNLFALIHQRPGLPNRSSMSVLENALSLGVELNRAPVVIAVGEEEKVNAPPFYEIVLMQAPPINQSPGEYIVEALDPILRLHSLFLLLLPASRLSAEIAGRLAVRFDAAPLVDVENLTIRNDQLTAVRHVQDESYRLSCDLHSASIIATIAPSTDARYLDLVPSIPTRTISIPEIETLSKVISVNALSAAASSESPRLDEARIVVAGGAGMGGKEGFDLLRKLCKEIGAALGASRSAVSRGWVESEHQIGLSGKVISPDLYLAFGISGSVQHQAGMGRSRRIVAVNHDAAAPIFRIATLGLVDDAHEVLEHLLAVFREGK